MKKDVKTFFAIWVKRDECFYHYDTEQELLEEWGGEVIANGYEVMQVTFKPTFVLSVVPPRPASGKLVKK